MQFCRSGAVFTRPGDSLPLEVWKRVVEDVKPWRPYFWLTGGEPTLYPQFNELVNCIKQNGMLVGVTTNGTTLTRLAESLLENSPDVIVVSIDGVGTVHNQVRGNPKAYERATEGIRHLQALKQRRDMTHPAIIINCALTPDNYLHAVDMIGVAAELGAEGLCFQHLWQMPAEVVRRHNAVWGEWHTVSGNDEEESEPENEPPQIDVSRLLDVIHQIRRQAADVPFPVKFNPETADEDIPTYYLRPDVFIRDSPVACAWLNADILPNGDVSPCFDLVCGNITQERFTDIWNNGAFRAHRRRLCMAGNFPICARCCAQHRKD